MYDVCLMPDNSGYQIINKATKVVEGEVPVFPQAVAMAEGWADSLEGLLQRKGKVPDPIKLVN